MLKTAYNQGKLAALAQFKLASDDKADDLVQLLGAVHPGAAGIGAGFMAPEGHGLGEGVRTGLGSAAGRVGGEAGGKALGQMIGALLHHPELGSMIGEIAGRTGGGAMGAHAGRLWGQESTAKDMMAQQKMGAELALERFGVKNAVLGQMVGKGLSMAGKAVGVLPTGVGNIAGAGLGALGGAMSAPPGKRLAGAAAGSLSGLPGGAGLVAPPAAGKVLGV